MITLDKGQEALLLEAIDNLLVGPRKEYVGICKNLKDRVKMNLGTCPYSIVTQLSESWEHSTGEDSYPVPYHESDLLWEGEQLEYRLDLLKHMKKCILEGALRIKPL